MQSTKTSEKQSSDLNKAEGNQSSTDSDRLSDLQFTELHLQQGTKARVKETFAVWSARHAKHEAQKKATIRERADSTTNVSNKSRPASAPVPRNSTKEEADPAQSAPSPAQNSRIMSSIIFLRSATHGVTNMIESLQVRNNPQIFRSQCGFLSLHLVQSIIILLTRFFKEIKRGIQASTEEQLFCSRVNDKTFISRPTQQTEVGATVVKMTLRHLMRSLNFAHFNSTIFDDHLVLSHWIS